MFKSRNIDNFKLLSGHRIKPYQLIGGIDIASTSDVILTIHRGDGVLEHVVTRNPCREIVLENFRIERS